MTKNKSLLLTYIFSLLGGFFGLHHLYLGRTQHALLWVTTFGGFGFGFVYEFLFLIKKYVHEANNDESVINEFRLKMIRRKTPAFEISRLCAQYLTAIFYGFITYYAFPDAWHANYFLSSIIQCCTTIAVALGTQLVGTLGPRQCSLIWPLLGAVFGMLFLAWVNYSSPSFNLPALLSSLVFELKVQWNSEYFYNITASKLMAHQSLNSSKQIKRKRSHILKRCLIYGLGAIAFSTIFNLAIYQNLEVHVNGRRIKIKDSIADFFKSNEFLLLRQRLVMVARQLWAFYFQYGFKETWRYIWRALDLESEKQAFKVLNISRTASQKEIESQCRTLSRQWHPDRYRDPEQKHNAGMTFMNIQQACDRLSYERKRRQLIKTQKFSDSN
ncbi:unnamed protein product [Rotaria socialis]